MVGELGLKRVTRTPLRGSGLAMLTAFLNFYSGLILKGQDR